MSKATNKKRNRNNPTVINEVAMAFGVSSRYVRMCLNGDRDGLNAGSIKKSYKTAIKEYEDNMKVMRDNIKKTAL